MQTDVPVTCCKTRQTSSTKEIEVCVLGSKWYGSVLEAVVSLVVDRSAINGQRGIRSELEHWSIPQVVNVRVDEGMTIRMAIENDNWAVKPGRELSLDFPHTSTDIPFGIISSGPGKVLGSCFVKPTHHKDPVEIPFFPPHVAPPGLVPRNSSDDQDMLVSRISRGDTTVYCQCINKLIS